MDLVYNLHIPGLDCVECRDLFSWRITQLDGRKPKPDWACRNGWGYC